jgi:Zn-dependent protease
MHLHLSWFYPVAEGLVLGILGMALHEVGHLVMAMASGVKVKNVGFCLKGMYTVREPGTPAKNLIISLAGPAVNFALIFTWPWFHLFALANVCFTVFNLIPMKGSDGDRVLTCWAQLRKDRAAGNLTTGPAKRVTLVTARRHSPLVTQLTQSGD